MDDRAPFYQLLSMTRTLKVAYREIDKICSKYFTESSIINPFIGFHSIVEVNDAEYSISPPIPRLGEIESIFRISSEVY